MYIIQQAAPHFFINNHTFTPPKVPVLLQILSGAHTAQELMPEGSVIPLPINKSIEINFPNGNGAPGGPHPFHLHGVRTSSFPPRQCREAVADARLLPL